MRRKAEVLKRLRRLAKSKAGSHPGVMILPHLALRARGRTPVEFASDYFRRKIRAPFTSPLAAQFQFVVEEPTQVRVSSRDRDEVVTAIQDELTHFHLYLSNFLTHPRYGPENQVGFCRGDTLRPVGLQEVRPGLFRFRVRGIIVGRRDLFAVLRGPNTDGPPPAPMPPAPPGTLRVFMCMPTRPDAPDVEDTEWYYFRPSKWQRKHRTNPLRGPIPVLLSPAAAAPPIDPQYDRLYRDGLVRIGVLFGYDAEHHLTTDDARDVWRILTAGTGTQFTARDTGPYGYHGPGLGFSDPTDGHFRRLNFEGTSVFRRDSVSGAGPIRVRYRLVSGALRVGGPATPEGTIFVRGRAVPAGQVIPVGTVVDRAIAAEVRLYNFDKAAPDLTAEELIGKFTGVFGSNEILHYDGHANYGGGFYIGEQEDDILWADDIGEYADRFNRRYQVFSIGACHSAGYFADLFYNELHPRKSPRNLDIIAAVNETDFADAVQQAMDLIRTLLQIKQPVRGEPPHYGRILEDMSRPAAFQAYIGVFGQPRTRRRR